MGYYCDSDQLAVIPEVPGDSDVIRWSDSFIGEPPPVTSIRQVLPSTCTTRVGEVFSGFFLTSKTNVGKLQAPMVPEYLFGHHCHHY